MKKVIFIVIIFFSFFSCDKDEEIELDYYIQFIANGQEYELAYVDCYYIENSSIADKQNMTFIYGYKSAENKINSEGEVYLETELPYLNIIIPLNETGSWTNNDTILYSIEIDKGIGFTKSKNEFPSNSNFEIKINEYGNIGGSCIGTFSGQLSNNSDDNLILEEGYFKIKISN